MTRVGAQNPTVDRDSRKMGSNKAAPGGASTPESQGLADDRSVD